ncbi:MAG: hypothetical protein KC466_00620, partial [Myxococcales bacterium]|nr:hypothetical protein [Myxococcales bacterium]
LGIPLAFAKTLVAVTVVSFAMTTLDSSARLLRFIISELGSKLNAPALGNRFVASGLAVGGAWIFATMKTGGKATGMVLWPVFGMSNQILAALGLLTLSVYLYKRRRPVVYTLVPLAFMLTMTMWAMLWSMRGYVAEGNWLLTGVGGVILFLELWLLVEGVGAWRSFRASDEPDIVVEAA